uniref:Retrovirus-related Pol polyprotein from transposon TNT 1-94 n=1 Tax=Tanacetum cinerariifolium TaxID=118510 RepID=A0A6L2L6Z8_TANCI|nr:hypothetical protein [Tanacetum cinerariifolium]
MEDRVMLNNSQGKKQEVEEHLRNVKFSKNKTSVTACNDSLNAKTSNVNFVCVTYGKCVLNDNHHKCVLHYLKGVNSRTTMPMAVPVSTIEPKRIVNQSVATPLRKTVASESTNQKPRHTTRKLYEHVMKTCSWWYPKFTPPEYKWKPKSHKGNVNPYIVEIILFIVDSGCSKHMTGNLKLLTNFVEKFLGLVKFGNDQIAPILGYGDLGNDLLTGSRGTDLYSITLQDTSSPNPIYLMAKATSSQAWLWHHRLSHLNFDTINLLLKNDIMIGLPKLKFVKDHLCSSCELRKSKRKSFQTKTTPSSKRRLQLLHMDLCGPMRVESINGKKYVLVIVDDYSRYTWTHFLRDGENLDKMKEKCDACIFVGYSTQSRAYRVFNKRIRVIVETIHVNFDELPQMASYHVSSNLVPQYQRTVLEHDSLSPGPQCQENVPHAAGTVTTSNELDLLFSAMFDELLNESTQFVSKSSTETTADAPNQCQQQHTTPLHTQTTPKPTCQVPSQAPTVTSTKNINQAKTVTENAQVEDDEFINIFCTPDKTEGSHHHPLEQVIRNPSQSVRTRRQLESDGEMCMFALTEEVYVNQLDGCVDPYHPDIVYHLKKALYGLKQAPKAWYDELSNFFVFKVFSKAKPTEKHLTTVKRIFWYLNDTINMGLWYPKDTGFELTAFLDLDHVGCLNSCKSTSGGIQFLCGDKTQLTYYGFHFDKIPMYCDSNVAIAVSCNSVQHSRTKHIDVRYHFIKEKVEKGIDELFFVRTEYQLAGLFTKALPEDRFKYLVRRLGMRGLTLEELEVLANKSA